MRIAWPFFCGMNMRGGTRSGVDSHISARYCKSGGMGMEG